MSFLIVFLLYCVYYPLRFSIEDPERQARYSSVFAITAGAFVPLNFISVRLAEAFTSACALAGRGDLPGEMRLTFLVSAAGDDPSLRDPVEAGADFEKRLRPAEATEDQARCPRCRLTRPASTSRART